MNSRPWKNAKYTIDRKACDLLEKIDFMLHYKQRHQIENEPSKLTRAQCLWILQFNMGSIWATKLKGLYIKNCIDSIFIPLQTMFLKGM